jgi:hypothetical protein
VALVSQGAPGSLGAALMANALGGGGTFREAPPSLVDGGGGQSASEASTAVPTAVAPEALAPDALQKLGGARWTCERCHTENPYTLDACGACGASLFAPLVEKKRQARDVPEQTVLAASILPGGGFFALGLPGSGVAHFLLSAWALGMGIAIPRPLFVKLLFLACGVGVWAVSAWDALVTRRHDPQSVILRPKVMMGLVGGLLVVLLGAMVLSTPRPSNNQGPSSGNQPTVVTGGTVGPGTTSNS